MNSASNKYQRKDRMKPLINFTAIFLPYGLNFNLSESEDHSNEQSFIHWQIIACVASWACIPRSSLCIAQILSTLTSTALHPSPLSASDSSAFHPHRISTPNCSAICSRIPNPDLILRLQSFLVLNETRLSRSSASSIWSLFSDMTQHS